MTIGFGTVAAIAALAGLIAMKKKEWQQAVPWLFLVAGLGIAGVFGAVVDRIAAVLTNVVGSTAGAVFGASAPLVVAGALGLLLWFGMRPKKGKPTKLTPWLALIFPAVLAGVPVIGRVVPLAVSFLSATIDVIWTTFMELLDALISGIGG